MANKVYYYVSGNTANGFVNYINSNLKGIKHIISLQHHSNQLKTNLINKIIRFFESTDDLEVIYSASGDDYLDGIIVRSKSLAIITDTITSPDLKKTKELFLKSRLDHEQVGKDSIKEAMRKCTQYKQEAYDHFSKGLKIHDQLEGIYINEMDFNKADHVAEEFINRLLDHVPRKNRTSTIYRRLFGTNTEGGSVNIVPGLIENISNRYYIKGRAGTGKSVLMKKVIDACKRKGLTMEVYHCSFDPESIDMVLVHELDFCMFDSTDPHEFTPERSDDKVIDLYEQTVTEGTDEKYANEINKVTHNYKTYMKKGLSSLKTAHRYQVKVEQNYLPIDEKELDDVTEEIIKMVK